MMKLRIATGVGLLLFMATMMKRSLLIRLTATMMALGIVFAIPAVASALPDATVTEVSFPPGAPFFIVVVAISKAIDTAARDGNADFGLHVTLTYVDMNGVVDTLDSGRLSIKLDTIQVVSIDNRTDAVALKLPLQVNPGPNPSYSATAELLQP